MKKVSWASNFAINLHMCWKVIPRTQNFKFPMDLLGFPEFGKGIDLALGYAYI